MKELPKRVVTATSPVVKSQAELLAATMMTVVPVKTGKLKSSIRVEKGKGDLNYIVKAGGPLTTVDFRKDAKGGAPPYDYAIATEFGTQAEPAHEFFWPTYRLMRKEIRAKIRKAMKDEIQKASAK